MADTKITALTALTAADPANDVIPIVDVSDTTMAASGTTKKISVNNILGASGTATLASASITGAATVGTTLGVTGATNLSGALTVSTGANATPLNLTCSNAAGTTFGLANTGGAGTHYFGGYNALVGGGNVTDLLINSAGQTIIRTGSTNVATFTTAGNLSLPTGNLVIGTAAKGIDFTTSADGSGTVTAELLNDYEEGTFTATLTGATTNPTIAVTSTGRYTKVGRIVTVVINFENVITTGASGTIGVAGLPFANNSNVLATCPVAFYSMATFTGSPFGEISLSASSIGFASSISNAIFGDVTHNAGTTRFLRTTATYQVA